MLKMDERILWVSYQHKVEKKEIPTCNIMGVDIAAINMEWLLKFTKKNIYKLSGDYMCVSNVYTTVTASEDAAYCMIQNGGIMAIPDGGPLSYIGRKRGYRNMMRTTGPSYMEEILSISEENNYTHFFYGGTETTIEKISQVLRDKYPKVKIVGMYSPPFRELTDLEDEEDIKRINATKPNFIWVGLGAPKQEYWMARHQGKVEGFMVGVGAGFDYLAGNIKRAPEWMQNNNMEWVYRPIQDPKRLLKKYLYSNSKFVWNAVIRRK